ncbi:hypothetical protein BJ508DRAFT_49996 [Ascobolus immersus RN42]|uniref:Uncharacterized protein n=1 Tax=Ascobolus immersus RN42 TaxID=1160509 RepID=A0A3N4HUR4_ASCIM|nr:hypothetical protein BJ508DRAFT_49996 [Ascobolus immersus RN42]
MASERPADTDQRKSLGTGHQYQNATARDNARQHNGDVNTIQHFNFYGATSAVFNQTFRDSSVPSIQGAHLSEREAISLKKSSERLGNPEAPRTGSPSRHLTSASTIGDASTRTSENHETRETPTSQQSRPASSRHDELLKKALTGIQFDPSIPIREWVTTAKKALENAKKEKDAEQQYVFYVQFTNLCWFHLPNHPEAKVNHKMVMPLWETANREANALSRLKKRIDSSS